MSDHLLIYVIVVLNSLCHVMLIWRQKLASSLKWKFCSLAVATPIVIMLIMRVMIASGTIHGRIVDQTLIEQCITKGTSALLIAGPWFVTIFTIIYRRRQGTAIDLQPAE